MKKGETITIREIHNGIEITPSHGMYCAPLNKDIIAFTNADDFISWIRQHFSIYEIPKWDVVDNKSLEPTQKQGGSANH